VESKIVVHNSIKDINQYCENKEGDVLVLCDLDNTLIEPKVEREDSPVGGDQWFSGLVEYVKNKKGISTLDAVKIVLPMHYDVQNRVVLKPVEEEKTVETIHDLKELYWVMGLTARSLPLVDLTVKKVSDLGFLFSFGSYSFQKKLSVDSVRLKDGILFCGNNDKGEALLELLSVLKINPKTIIFIDDKYANVEKLDKIFQSRKDIEFIGIHYIYLKSKVESFVLDQMSQEQIINLI